MSDTHDPSEGDVEPGATPVPVPPLEEAPSSTGVVIEDDADGSSS